LECRLIVIGVELIFFLQSVLEKKKSKGILKLGQNRSGGVVVSHKQGIVIIYSDGIKQIIVW